MFVHVLVYVYIGVWLHAEMCFLSVILLLFCTVSQLCIWLCCIPLQYVKLDPSFLARPHIHYMPGYVSAKLNFQYISVFIHIPFLVLNSCKNVNIPHVCCVCHEKHYSLLSLVP